MSQKVTTITIFGRYEVTCRPDPEPADTELNCLEVYYQINDLIQTKLIRAKLSESKHSQRAIQAWLDKFPKPLNQK